MQTNIEVSYKSISTLWESNFLTRWYYPYWWTCSSILKVLKVKSLQYFKNEVRDGIHFLHADKYQGFYKLALLFLMKVGRNVPSTQNRKFLNEVSQLLLCCKTFKIFYRGLVMFFVTCFICDNTLRDLAPFAVSNTWKTPMEKCSKV